MNEQVTFLIDSLVEDIASFLIQDSNLTIPEALDFIYNSQLYEKIIDTETGLYFQSSSYNYDLLKKEIKYGKIA